MFPAPPSDKQGWPWIAPSIPPAAVRPGQPRISIVVPSLNQAAYLEETLRSILLQNYPNLECIVIDGGSTDDSRAILEKYSPWLTAWVSEPDTGQSNAINKGFALSTGDIITFLSSDDYYLPGAFSDVAGTFHHNPEAGAIVGAFSFLDPGHAQPNEPIQPFLGIPAPADLSLGPPGVYRLHQAATFYTRRALDAVGRSVREDMKYVMDRELLYRVCRAFPLAISPRAYGVFRRHPESKSSAEILPFAREFASLYLLHLNGDAKQDRLRKRMAAYRLSRGWIKHAQHAHTPAMICGALFRAGILYPPFLLSTAYWQHYRRLFKAQKQPL